MQKFHHWKSFYFQIHIQFRQLQSSYNHISTSKQLTALTVFSLATVAARKSTSSKINFSFSSTAPEFSSSTKILHPSSTSFSLAGSSYPWITIHHFRKRIHIYFCITKFHIYPSVATKKSSIYICTTYSVHTTLQYILLYSVKFSIYTWQRNPTYSSVNYIQYNTSMYSIYYYRKYITIYLLQIFVVIIFLFRHLLEV